VPTDEIGRLYGHLVYEGIVIRHVLTPQDYLRLFHLPPIQDENRGSQ
jgi:hypothetical protein